MRKESQLVIYEYPLNKDYNIDNCVLALGFFDGVHIAHRDLLEKARNTALKRGIKFGIFTFKSSGNIKHKSARLYDDSDKADFFRELNADFSVFADFSAISDCSPEDFVKTILIKELSCKICVAGFNFRFGKGAKAGAEQLSRFMDESGCEALICEEISTNDGSTISATMIRELISEGRIEEANALLGSPYYIKGRVLHGRADGRKLGFPTANIVMNSEKTIPRLGVYRSATVIDGKIISGVTNIGKCPTFNGDEIRLEIHLIDFDGDIYGREIKVYLLGFLRDERAFDTIESLKMQIIIDKETTIKENGDIKWQELGLK